MRCRYAASTDAVGLECSDVAVAIVSHTSHECHFSRSTCHECVCRSCCAVFLMTHTPFIRLLLLNHSVTSQIYFHTHNTTGDCRFFIESPPPTTAKQCFLLLLIHTSDGMWNSRRPSHLSTTPCNRQCHLFVLVDAEGHQKFRLKTRESLIGK